MSIIESLIGPLNTVLEHTLAAYDDRRDYRKSHDAERVSKLLDILTPTQMTYLDDVSYPGKIPGDIFHMFDAFRYDFYADPSLKFYDEAIQESVDDMSYCIEMFVDFLAENSSPIPGKDDQNTLYRLNAYNTIDQAYYREYPEEKDWLDIEYKRLKDDVVGAYSSFLDIAHDKCLE